MKISDERQQDIDDLANALEQLILAQRNVDTVLERIQSRTNNTSVVPLEQVSGDLATERRR